METLNMLNPPYGQTLQSMATFIEINLVFSYFQEILTPF